LTKATRSSIILTPAFMCATLLSLSTRLSNWKQYSCGVCDFLRPILSRQACANHCCLALGRSLLTRIRRHLLSSFPRLVPRTRYLPLVGNNNGEAPAKASPFLAYQVWPV